MSAFDSFPVGATDSQKKGVLAGLNTSHIDQTDKPGVIHAWPLKNLGNIGTQVDVGQNRVGHRWPHEQNGNAISHLVWRGDAKSPSAHPRDLVTGVENINGKSDVALRFGTGRRRWLLRLGIDEETVRRGVLRRHRTGWRGGFGGKLRWHTG